MKINFLGDSITQGACATKDENTYTALVCKHFGAERCCFGIGGTRIARQVENKDEYDKGYFMTRAVKMPKDADFTFVFGGTNDYGHGDAPLGNINSTSDYTFYGAVKNLANYIVDNFPKDKVCFILPIPRYNQDSPYGEGFKKEPAHSLSTYINAEKEVLDSLGIEYLDLSNSFYLPQTKEPFDIYQDGLHPNDKGHALLASLLIDYLKKRNFP